MNNIFKDIAAALEKEERVMIATVIATTGSTPASALSKMLITSGGSASTGTVGGGCMEGDVLEAARKLYGTGKAAILTFHLNEDEMVQGLICGGSLDVLVEPVERKLVSLVNRIQSIREEGEDCILVTRIARDGTVRSKFLLADGWDELRTLSVDRAILEDAAAKARRRNETRRISLSDGDLFFEPIQGQPPLIIFGAGHVSKYICRAAATAGFGVTVVDDRERYVTRERFPKAAEILACEFTESFSRLSIRPSTFVVIVTRGHRYDEEILGRAVRTSAKYIGMIGSRRKVMRTYEHLVQEGVPIKMLQRVYAPMGIEIGASTAEEIGISVVAQLIAVRRGAQEPFRDKSSVMSELFPTIEQRSLSHFQMSRLGTK